MALQLANESDYGKSTVPICAENRETSVSVEVGNVINVHAKWRTGNVAVLIWK